MKDLKSDRTVCVKVKRKHTRAHAHSHINMRLVSVRFCQVCRDNLSTRSCVIPSHNFENSRATYSRFSSGINLLWAKLKPFNFPPSEFFARTKAPWYGASGAWKDSLQRVWRELRGALFGKLQLQLLAALVLLLNGRLAYVDAAMDWRRCLPFSAYKKKKRNLLACLLPSFVTFFFFIFEPWVSHGVNWKTGARDHATNFK